jgi:hypothetical protein
MEKFELTAELKERFLNKSENSIKFRIINTKSNTAYQECKFCLNKKFSFVHIDLMELNHHTRKYGKSIFNKIICIDCFVDLLNLLKLLNKN